MDMGMKAELENIQALLGRLAATLSDSETMEKARKGFEEADMPVSVEVEADSPESLEEGLELAKGVVPSEGEEEMEESPELEGLEEQLHTDLDGDNEEGEDPAHAEAVLGSGEGFDAVVDPEELKKAVLARLLRK